jgi:hypothetical protein
MGYRQGSLDAQGGLRHPLGMDINMSAQIGSSPVVIAEKVKYCLYARKSSEDSSEKQAL